MAVSGVLGMSAQISRVNLHSLRASARPSNGLPRPCAALAVCPRPYTSTKNPFLNWAAPSSPLSASPPNLWVEAGGKKDKLKKHRKGNRRLIVHKALGQDGGSVLPVSAKLSPEEIWEREERRWEREELRWLREEQRWLKEESRWERERAEWAQEEAQLKNHVEALKASLAETQYAGENRADAVRQSLEEESAQAQIIGQAALEAQLTSDAQLLKLAREQWWEEKQTLLAEVDALKTALAEVLNEAKAKAEAARKSWQKHETALQAEIAQLKHSLLEAQAVAQARGGAKTSKPERPVKEEKAPKAQKPETIVAPAPSDAEIIAAVASRTPTPISQGVFKTAPSNGAPSNGASASTPPTPKRTLRYGAEGADVKAVQETLERLGFYCGEEEMEADAYEDGTDSAVKSWQCSMGVKEDGVLTPELQALLLGLEKAVFGVEKGAASEVPVLQKDRVVESERYARTNAEGSETGSTRRVYLLGENRWEEPGRLVPANAKVLAMGMQKCFACKGEGKVLCTECEGTGELNVEEQFLSWAGEDPCCPYCNGSGVSDCDTCEGTGLERIVLK